MPCHRLLSAVFGALVALALTALTAPIASAAPLSVRLMSGLPSPQRVGTVLALVPHLENNQPGMHVFRYSVSVDGGAFHLIRDFSQQRELVWAPALYEHDARVRVTVRNNATHDTAEAELPFRIVSRVTS